MSLGLQVQGQSPGTQGAAAQPAAAQPAAKGGINALLDSVKTSGDDFLPPDRAFRFDALPDGTDRVRLNWEIADGYYLYRARIKVVTPSPRAQLGAPQMPQGQIKTDEYFGRQEVYHHELVATVPVLRASGGAFELPLQVTYQGCAEAGLCYPPITKTVTVNLSAGATSSGTASAGSFVRGAGGRGPAGAGRVPAVVGADPVCGPVRGARALDARAVHAADAGRDPDAHRQHQQPPVRRHLRRCRRHGRALGPYRHHLRGTGARRSAARDQPERAGVARWRGAVRHERRHGDAVAGGRRLGGAAAAQGRTLDGPG